MPKGYKNVKLTGDGDAFTLEYTPTEAHGRPQRLRLDADNEDDARFEAASVLECDEKDLPETEWH